MICVKPVRDVLLLCFLSSIADTTWEALLGKDDGVVAFANVKAD